MGQGMNSTNFEHAIYALLMQWIGVVPALVAVNIIGLAAIWAALVVALHGWAYVSHLTAALCGLYGLLVCHNWRQIARQGSRPRENEYL